MSDILLRRLRAIERDTLRLAQSTPGEKQLPLSDMWRPVDLLRMHARYGIGWR